MVAFAATPSDQMEYSVPYSVTQSESNATNDAATLPADSSEAPVDSSETPADSTEAPASSSETPADSTEAPASSSEAPASSSEAPADSNEAPADSNETPADSSEAPAEKIVPVIDRDTHGDWMGKYGSEGYLLFAYDRNSSYGDRKNLPDYVENVVVSSRTRYTDPSTDAAGGLPIEEGNEGNRKKAFVIGNPISIAITMKDTETHSVSLYLADVDANQRENNVQLFAEDGTTPLSDVVLVKEFKDGVYLTFEVNQSVVLKVTNALDSGMAIANAVFFGQGEKAPEMITPVIDHDTHGDWMGKYGSEGSLLFAYDRNSSYGDRKNLPEYVESVSVTPRSRYTDPSTDAPGGLPIEADNAGTRKKAFVMGSPIKIAVTMKDAKKHSVSLYLADVDANARENNVQLFAEDGTTPLSEPILVKEFKDGVYLTFEVKQSVVLQVTNALQTGTALANAVFFGVGEGTGENPGEPEDKPDENESLVPQSRMKATASHFGVGDTPAQAIDGDKDAAANGKTVWSSWGRGDGTDGKDPQWLMVKMDQEYSVKAFKMTGRSNEPGGFITSYDLEVSTDGKTFEKVIADGSFEVPKDGVAVRGDLKEVTKAKYVRLVAKDCAPYKNGSTKFWPAISNLEIVVTDKIDPELPPPAEQVWATPEIVPEPVAVAGVSKPVINLNDSTGSGAWRYLFDTPMEIPGNDTFDFSAWDDKAWQNIKVPGEPLMQGFDIQADRQYYYKTTIQIPQDYSGNRILVRFNGVYSDANVWVENQFVRSHMGGFTTWDCDITEIVGEIGEGGKQVSLVVGVKDNSANPSYASKYAHHNIGGILRDVELMAVPKDYIKSVQVTTELDDTFTNAELKLDAAVGLVSEKATLEFELKDPSGNVVALDNASMEFDQTTERVQLTLPVSQPTKWDAEHPNLYELKTTLKVGGEIKQETVEKIGFREITYGTQDTSYDKNKIYVNGMEVKLRGTCRHDISYDLGRTVTDEHIKKELEAYKEMNINFVRTSHYPPSKRFLELCDEIGIYVEEETAVCFSYSPNWLGEAAFLDQYTEMIERDRNHASVLIWSLGNESFHYANPTVYQKEFDYVKNTDQTRPVIFSWPSTVDGNRKPYDIYSAHYAQWDLSDGGAQHGNPNYAEMPVIHDEYAHIPCYNIGELTRDVNVRNFWGESIKRFWDNILEKDGALGGALWGGIDDVFYIPEGTTERYRTDSEGDVAGYGEWGSVLDVFLRWKPEAWLTKKAYSPIRVDEDAIVTPAAGSPLVMSVGNWFDHTNLNEVKLVYQINEESAKTMALENLAPHAKGEISVPAANWKQGDKVNLKFYTGYGSARELLIDEYNILIGGVQVEFEKASDTAPTISEDEATLTVSGKDFSIRFNKSAAQIEKAAFKEDDLIIGGPRLNGFNQLWVPDASNPISSKIEGNKAYVSLLGAYDEVGVRFDLEISGNGIMVTNYTLLDAPKQTDGYPEVGVVYDIAPQVESVSWLKDGFWSAYPEDHIGRNEGTAYRVRENAEAQPDTYGALPGWAWKDDMRNFFLYPKNSDKDGVVTNDFKTMRENVWFYNTNFENTNSIIRVESEGKDAARVSYAQVIPGRVDNVSPRIKYTGGWMNDMVPGNYEGTIAWSLAKNATCEMDFEGTGIKLIGPMRNIDGKCTIYIDGVLDGEVDIKSTIGSNQNQKVLYTKTDLPVGRHTIKIVASGGGIGVDALEVISGKTDESNVQAQLIVNNQWYYPDLGWGNYLGISGKLDAGSTGSVTLRLTEEKTENEIVSLNTAKVTTVAGTAPVLPKQITAVYTDGATAQLDVIWDAVDAGKYQTAGEFTVEGSCAETAQKAICVVTVTAKPGVTITASVNPAQAGEVTGNKNYTVGEEVTLTSTAKSGYRFVGWYQGEQCISTKAEMRFTATENASYEARFEPVTPEKPVTPENPVTPPSPATPAPTEKPKTPAKQQEQKYLEQLISSGKEALAKGRFTAGTVLEVLPLEQDSEAYTLLAEQAGEGEIIAAFEVILKHGKATGSITLSFEVGAKYDGRTVLILHKQADGVVERLSAVVKDGKATVTVKELSPFLIALEQETPAPTTTPESSSQVIPEVDSSVPATTDSEKGTGFLPVIGGVLVAGAAVAAFFLWKKKREQE